MSLKLVYRFVSVAEC